MYKYKVTIDDAVYMHDYKPGDRVRMLENRDVTGTVEDVTENGLFIWIKWDDHCKGGYGRSWMPSGIQYCAT